MAVVEFKKQIGVIDLTPKWSDMVTVLELLFVDGNPTARAHARAELTRMAKLADLYVEAQKATTAATPDSPGPR